MQKEVHTRRRTISLPLSFSSFSPSVPMVSASMPVSGMPVVSGQPHGRLRWRRWWRSSVVEVNDRRPAWVFTANEVDVVGRGGWGGWIFGFCIF